MRFALKAIAILLIKILQQRSTFGWALSNLVALLRWNLVHLSQLMGVGLYRVKSADKGSPLPRQLALSAGDQERSASTAKAD